MRVHVCLVGQTLEQLTRDYLLAKEIYEKAMNAWMEYLPADEDYDISDEVEADADWAFEQLTQARARYHESRCFYGNTDRIQAFADERSLQ